jgi:hypothetical protein
LVSEKGEDGGIHIYVDNSEYYAIGPWTTSRMLLEI